LTEAVLDASVVLKWFRTGGERNVDAARELRARFEAGRLVAFAPALLFLEILNVAGRRWRLPANELQRIAASLPRLGLRVLEPELPLLAAWVAQGLTAYDAAYVAVAEQTGTRLITDDREIIGVAPSFTTPLAGVP
jgi:predicted nucleic acid-binding protein